MRHLTRIARRLLTSLTLALTLATLAPTWAVAGTYTFNIPAAQLQLGNIEPGSAWQAIGGWANFMAPTRGWYLDPTMWKRQWLALPAGAVFTDLQGTVEFGTQQSDPNPNVAIDVLVQRPDGQYTTLLWQTLGLNMRSETFLAPAGYRPHAIRFAMTVLGGTFCDWCLYRLTSLGGTIDDNELPTLALTSPHAGKATASRNVEISYDLTDRASGPAQIDLQVNGEAQPGHLWMGGPIDQGRFVAQRSVMTSASGTITIPLPDRDGTHTLQLTGQDVVANPATSEPIRITLDRTPPELAVAAPEGWCSTPCTVTISATDLTGVATVTAELDAKPVPVLGGGPYVVDLAAAGLRGTGTLTIRATDSFGQASEKIVKIKRDPDTPTIQLADADPQSRRVVAQASDTSGIAGVSVEIEGRLYDLAAGRTPVQYAAEIPASAGPLDEKPAALIVTDNASNTTTAPLTFRSRVVTELLPWTGRKTVTYPETITVTGRLTGAPAGSEVLLQLANPSWPEGTQTWIAATRADGGYSLTIKPQLSGILAITYAGTANHRPTIATTGHVKVRPLIRARVTATPMLDGRLRDLRVRGTIRPADAPLGPLLLQARAPGTSRWLDFCPGGGRITVADGRLEGRCPLVGINAGVEYRVAYRPGSIGVVAAGTSRPVIAW